MKLRVLSDLHIEFYPFHVPPLPDDHESILILAGDVGNMRDSQLLQNFLLDVSARFREIIYVLGNHEFYGNAWPYALEDVRRWRMPKNLHVLERESLIIDEVGFAGATLWTDYDCANPLSMITIQHRVNDYMAIRFAPKHKMSDMRKLTPDDLLADHEKSKAWLAAALLDLRSQCRQVVLITHHGISRQSIGEKFRASAINGAFVSDLENLLNITPPDIAIHGHVHNSCDYRLENSARTRVIANPRGYARDSNAQENAQFDACLVIEV